MNGEGCFELCDCMPELCLSVLLLSLSMPALCFCTLKLCAGMLKQW